jgi:glycerate-2-kinase
MAKEWIKNKADLATTPERKLVLDIVESGLDAIDTESAIRAAVSLDQNILRIKDQTFDLSGVRHVYVVGFGKVSCMAASILDDILGEAIKHGVAIGVEPVACEFIDTYGGNHPLPSLQNVELSQKIVELSKNLSEEDLVITIVSGGGSALLCWPIEECHQATRLYEEFLKTGGDIKELNTIRKHISSLKGGGLAKLLYPARVVGLVFSDVPGDAYDFIASGPTYKDDSTVADAQAILDRYQLTGYTLNETPKEDMYFERVTNIPLVSNIDALHAMQQKSESLGLPTKIISSELYDAAPSLVEKFLNAVEPGTIVLGAGEPEMVVPEDHGYGGRCQHVALEMLPHITAADTFATVASDGIDNGDAAGAIEDYETLTRAKEKKLDMETYKQKYDSCAFYRELGNELLKTGPTHTNVSDFMIFYRKNNNKTI